MDTNRQQRRLFISLVSLLTFERSFRKSVSIGIAEWDGSESNDALFARADQALLQAKQSGRNRVAVAERDGSVTG